jgi:single-strand DNA-binding protein
MNSVNIIGNITKDIELKYTTNNKAVVNTTIAVNDGFGDNQKTNFIDVQIWEKVAENIAKYCGKGSKIAVSGKLIQQTWEYEGKKQSKVLIQANNVIFLDNKKQEQDGQAPVNEEEKQEESDPFAEFGSEVQLSSEDLPF